MDRPPIDQFVYEAALLLNILFPKPVPTDRRTLTDTGARSWYDEVYERLIKNRWMLKSSLSHARILKALNSLPTTASPEQRLNAILAISEFLIDRESFWLEFFSQLNKDSGRTAGEKNTRLFTDGELKTFCQNVYKKLGSSQGGTASYWEVLNALETLRGRKFRCNQDILDELMPNGTALV